jgi:hypothetical protein
MIKLSTTSYLDKNPEDVDAEFAVQEQELTSMNPKYLNEKVHPINIITFELIPENNSLVRIKTNWPVIVELSQCIANVPSLPIDQNTRYFTFTLNKPFSKLKTTEPISLKYYRPAYLMVYCDIVEQSIISGTYAQILCTVPVRNVSFSKEYQFQEFEIIQYHDEANYLREYQLLFQNT